MTFQCEFSSSYDLQYMSKCQYSRGRKAHLDEGKGEDDIKTISPKGCYCICYLILRMGQVKISGVIR